MIGAGQTQPRAGLSESASLDSAVKRFETAWRQGQAPAIDDHLQADGPARQEILVELVHIDLEVRLKRGEPVRVENYLARYAALGSDPATLVELVATEFEFRARHDPLLTVGEYVRRFPQLADELKNHFDLVSTVNRRSDDSNVAKSSDQPTSLSAVCPRCGGRVSLADETRITEITCPACQMSFSLAEDASDVVLVGSSSEKPRMLAQFELLEKLGEGAFGAVWKARDATLDRTVAIKIPSRDRLAAADVEQFFREARAAARLRHPSIVTVHEVGRHEKIVYIVSDFIDGAALDKHMAERRFTHRQSLDICLKVAEALEHSHRSGVIHRDLKPGNILLDKAGDPHITDFGLARRDAGEATLTVDGQVLGTPAYMSPEQAKGQSRLADARADIYSLGVLLFELLTGERPFRGNVRMLLRQVIEDEPPSPRKLDGAIPRDLETIVLKCLQKESGRRYQTAAELSAEFRRFLAGEPILARPVGPVERIGRWCRRKPVIAALLATVALLVILGTSGVTWKWRDAEANLTRALTAEKTAGEETIKARHEADNARSQQHIAEQQRRVAEENRYAADMRLGQQAADEGNFGRAISLLERYRPSTQLPELPDLREFEWRHLCWICQGDSIATYHSGAGQVLSAAFSPNGQILATAGDDGAVLLHDPANLDRAPVRLPALGQSVQAIEFSPDGKFLACATGNPRSTVVDCQVHLWDVSAQKFIAVLDDPRTLKTINSVAFSSDGALLATASEDDQVRVWKLGPDGNQLVAKMPGYSRGANDVSFAAGSHRLAIGWGNGRLEVWDVDTNKRLVDQSVHVSGIIALAFAPDGQTIVVASRDGPIFYWDMNANKLSEPAESGQGIVESVKFSSDGSQFITGGSNCTVALWDFASRRPINRFRGHRDIVFSVAFAPHSRLFASASLDGTVKLWDSTKRRDAPSLAHQGTVESLAFSADSKLLVTAEGRSASSAAQHPGTIYLWDLRSRPPQATPLTARHGDVNSVAISRDGSLLASGSADHTAIVWDAATKKPLATLDEQSSVSAVRFSPSATTPLLATGAERGSVKLWAPDAQGQWTAIELGRHLGMVTSVSFSPDGSLLASSCGDGTVRLWDVAKRNLIATLEGHQGACYTAAFSPDGATLATGSHDRTVRIWDIKGRKFRKEDAVVLPSYNASITSLAFSPDGKTLAGGNRDSTVVVWSASSLKELALFPAHRGGVLCCAFSPDQSLLATGGTDQTVKLWNTIDSPDGRELFEKKTGWSRP